MTDPGQGTKADTSRWPVEIRLKKAEKVLEIDFDDGRTFSLPAEFLRVYSPSVAAASTTLSKRRQR